MLTPRTLDQEKAAYSIIAAPCPSFGVCGGCALQDLAYQDQLSVKQQRINQVLQGLDPSLQVTLQGLEDPWRYRNKAELTFSRSEGRLTLGYHQEGSFWRVVDLDDCLLLPDPMAQTIRQVRALAQALGPPAYHPRTHDGFWRHLTVRYSRATGQVMVCVTTTPGPRALMAQFAEALMARAHQVASVYWGIRSSIADVAEPEELIWLRGAACLEEQVGNFRLAVRPFAFLQPNSQQAHRLYECVTRAVPPVSDGVAWDLYCGMGLVAFYLAPRFRTVYGIDASASNLESAVANAARNGIDNVTFRLGRVEDVLRNRRFWLQEAKPSLVAVDPPRSGLHPRALASIEAARPPHVAYLSCNVQTLVRDLQLFRAGYPRYGVRQLAAFDMFPHTNHVELFALLEREAR